MHRLSCSEADVPDEEVVPSGSSGKVHLSRPQPSKANGGRPATASTDLKNSAKLRRLQTLVAGLRDCEGVAAHLRKVVPATSTGDDAEQLAVEALHWALHRASVPFHRAVQGNIEVDLIAKVVMDGTAAQVATLLQIWPKATTEYLSPDRSNVLHCAAEQNQADPDELAAVVRTLVAHNVDVLATNAGNNTAYDIMQNRPPQYQPVAALLHLFMCNTTTAAVTQHFAPVVARPCPPGLSQLLNHESCTRNAALRTALVQLRDDVVGLHDIKEKVAEVVAALVFGRGFAMSNFALQGASGTGKSHCARLIANVLVAARRLHSPSPNGQRKPRVVYVHESDLVAGYAGQTAPKVLDFLNRHRGCVLVFEEVLELGLKGDHRSDFVAQAVSTWMTWLAQRPALAGDGHSNVADTVSCIVAGPPKDLQQHFGSNPGFAARFHLLPELPPPDPSMMWAICLAKMRKWQVRVPWPSVMTLQAIEGAVTFAARTGLFTTATHNDLAALYPNARGCADQLLEFAQRAHFRRLVPAASGAVHVQCNFAWCYADFYEALMQMAAAGAGHRKDYSRIKAELESGLQPVQRGVDDVCEVKLASELQMDDRVKYEALRHATQHVYTRRGVFDASCGHCGRRSKDECTAWSRSLSVTCLRENCARLLRCLSAAEALVSPSRGGDGLAQYAALWLLPTVDATLKHELVDDVLKRPRDAAAKRLKVAVSRTELGAATVLGGRSPETMDGASQPLPLPQSAVTAGSDAVTKVRVLLDAARDVIHCHEVADELRSKRLADTLRLAVEGRKWGFIAGSTEKVVDVLRQLGDVVANMDNGYGDEKSLPQAAMPEHRYTLPKSWTPSRVEDSDGDIVTGTRTPRPSGKNDTRCDTQALRKAFANYEVELQDIARLGSSALSILDERQLRVNRLNGMAKKTLASFCFVGLFTLVFSLALDWQSSCTDTSTNATTNSSDVADVAYSIAFVTEWLACGFVVVCCALATIMSSCHRSTTAVNERHSEHGESLEADVATAKLLLKQLHTMQSVIHAGELSVIAEQPSKLLSLLQHDNAAQFTNSAKAKISAAAAARGVRCASCLGFEHKHQSLARLRSRVAGRNPSTWKPRYRFPPLTKSGRWVSVTNAVTGLKCMAQRLIPNDSVRALKEAALLSQFRHSSILALKTFYWSPVDGYVLVTPFVGKSLRNMFATESEAQDLAKWCWLVYAQV